MTDLIDGLSWVSIRDTAAGVFLGMLAYAMVVQLWHRIVK